MGTVWLAERNDGRFERRVAVKVLNIALMGKGGEERFKTRGPHSGRLTHPHIAELIDAGVSLTASPFLFSNTLRATTLTLLLTSTGSMSATAFACSSMALRA